MRRPAKDRCVDLVGTSLKTKHTRRRSTRRMQSDQTSQKHVAKWPQKEESDCIQSDTLRPSSFSLNTKQTRIRGWGWVLTRVPKKLTRVAAPSPRASLGRRTVCGRTEQLSAAGFEALRNYKVRIGRGYLWGSFLMLPQRSKHPREMVITPKASTSIFVSSIARSLRPSRRPAVAPQVRAAASAAHGGRQTPG